MSKTKTTAVSGCLIWFILVMVIGTCVMPVFFTIGTVSSFSDFAINTTGGWLFPQGTTPQSHTYPTTSRDQNGFEHSATGYELQCLDASGEIVKTDPVLFSFIWIGICAASGMIVTAVLVFVFAVPGGALVTKLFDKLKSRRAK